MNRFEKIVSSLTTVRRNWDDVFLRNHPFDGSGEEVKKDPYKRSNLVFVCISTTARSISQVPLMIGKRNSKGTFIPLKSNDPWVRLLNRPNYLMDRYSFVEAIVSHLLLDGNVWVLPFPPSWKSIPAAMFVLPRKNMEPLKGEAGNLMGWNYKPNASSSVIPIRFDEISQVKFFNPDDPIMGQRPLDAGEMPLLGDFKAQKFNNNFFDEGAVPYGVLSAERSLTETQRTRLRQEFEDRHKGFEKSHRLAVLEGGLKYTRVGLSHEDMQFFTLRKYNRDEILQVFGMKKAVISVTDDLNFATAREQRREWWEGTNLPIMRLVCASLSYSFFQDSGIDLEFQFDINSIEALQEQFKDKVDSAFKLYQIGFVGNEINARLQLGFEDKWWRDIWYAPLNMAPVDTERNSAGSQEPAPKPQPLPADENADGKNLLAKTPPLLVSHEKVDKDKRSKHAWDNLMAKTDPLEEQLYRKVKWTFYLLRSKVLDNLFKKSINDVMHMDFEEEKDLLEKYSRIIWEGGMNAGAESLQEDSGISISWDIHDPIAIEFMALKTPLIRNVIDDVKNIVNQICLEGMQNGRSVDEIATSIRAEFTDMVKWRANAIARTEVIGAANFGRYVGIMNSGFAEKEWWTAQDERVREDHKEMDGQTISALGGVVWTFADGTYVRFPGDPLGPAHQVVNCRCIEVVGEK